MTDAKKSSGMGNGPFVVVGILLVCAAAAYLAVVHRQSQISAMDGAQLLYEGQVMATFAKSNVPIDEGMPAIVTVKGYSDQKFPGKIKLTHVEENGETTAIIQLSAAPTDAKPPVPCKVTVDTATMIESHGG
jgi:Tfp pilus assembly protein PilE